MAASRRKKHPKAERPLINSATREALRFHGRGHGKPRKRTKPGSQPHAISIQADATPPRIDWIRFSNDTLDEQRVTDIAALEPAFESSTVDWVHVQGFGDEGLLRALAELFGIHPLALADIVNVPQRAKVDSYGDRQLVVLRMARNVDGAVELQQFSLVVGPTWVISFEEHVGDVFDPIRERLRLKAGTLRNADAGFLAFALVDAVVDGFFPVTDTLSDAIEDLEEAAIGDPEPHTLARIHAVRRLLIHLSRVQRQQRDAVVQLGRLEAPPFGPALRPYLRDVEDHAIHVLEIIDTLREMTLGVMDIYLSSVNNRTNEAIRVLTVMASLFIPLTFVTGVYGMNFENMPELHWRWGYLAAWGAMVAIGVGLLAWFRRRDWLRPYPLPGSKHPES